MASVGKIVDALRALPSEKALDTLELIDKLTQNIVRNPTEEKFRRIKLSNPKIAAAITNVPSAVDALKQMGWIESLDGLSLPQSVCFAHEMEVSAIIQAKEHFNKETESKGYPDKTGKSTANVDLAVEDTFEYDDMDRKPVRLVKHRNDSSPHIEVFVEGVSFWKGIPTLSQSTGLLAFGTTGTSAVPEVHRTPLQQFLAAMPAPRANSTAANVDWAVQDDFEYTDRDREKVRLVKHRNDSPPQIEVFVEGASFWKGVPTFSQSTGLLACGSKGASAVPETYHEGLQQYLAAMPPPPKLRLNLA